MTARSDESPTAAPETRPEPAGTVVVEHPSGGRAMVFGSESTVVAVVGRSAVIGAVSTAAWLLPE